MAVPFPLRHVSNARAPQEPSPYPLPPSKQYSVVSLFNQVSAHVPANVFAAIQKFRSPFHYFSSPPPCFLEMLPFLFGIVHPTSNLLPRIAELSRDRRYHQCARHSQICSPSPVLSLPTGHLPLWVVLLCTSPLRAHFFCWKANLFLKIAVSTSFGVNFFLATSFSHLTSIEILSFPETFFKLSGKTKLFFSSLAEFCVWTVWGVLSGFASIFPSPLPPPVDRPFLLSLPSLVLFSIFATDAVAPIF